MVDLSSALSQLRLERRKAEEQVGKIDQAISVLEGLDGHAGNGKRPVSAEARHKMALAQQARWAKVRAAATSSNGAKTDTAVRKPMSLATRRKLAAAQRARWARQRKAA
jgi:hypothetical protein